MDVQLQSLSINYVPRREHKYPRRILIAVNKTELVFIEENDKRTNRWTRLLQTELGLKIPFFLHIHYPRPFSALLYALRGWCLQTMSMDSPSSGFLLGSVNRRHRYEMGGWEASEVGVFFLQTLPKSHHARPQLLSGSSPFTYSLSLWIPETDPSSCPFRPKIVRAPLCYKSYMVSQ